MPEFRKYLPDELQKEMLEFSAIKKRQLNAGRLSKKENSKKSLKSIDLSQEMLSELGVNDSIKSEDSTMTNFSPSKKKNRR